VSRSDDFHNGIVRPLVRSGCIVTGLFTVAVVATFLTRNGNWFFGVMLGGCLVLFLTDRWLRPNKSEEDAASRRWFGIDR
jgi:hypothetical protein